MTSNDLHYNDQQLSPRLWIGFALLLCGVAHAQVNPSPLVYIQTIGVPNWTNTGSTQANSDIFGFNPQTHILYMADRVRDHAFQHRPSVSPPVPPVYQILI
jgi:hypothetical protein